MEMNELYKELQKLANLAKKSNDKRIVAVSKIIFNTLAMILLDEILDFKIGVDYQHNEIMRNRELRRRDESGYQ